MKINEACYYDKGWHICVRERDGFCMKKKHMEYDDIIQYQPEDDDELSRPVAAKQLVAFLLILVSFVIFLGIISKPKLDMLQNGRIPDAEKYNTAVINQNSVILMSLMEPEYECQLLEEFQVKYQERLERYPYVFGTLNFNGRPRSVKDLNYIACLCYTQAEYISMSQGLEESSWTVVASANHNMDAGSYYGAALTYTLYWNVIYPDQIAVGERSDILNRVQDKVQDILEGLTQEDLNDADLLASVQKRIDDTCSAVNTRQMKVRCEANAIRKIQERPPDAWI